MKWHHLFAIAILAQPLVAGGAGAQPAPGAAPQQQQAVAPAQQPGAAPAQPAAGAKGAQPAGAAAQIGIFGGGAQAQNALRALFARPVAVGDEHAYPAKDVRIEKSKIGPVFADAQGKTLYGVNLRYVAFRGGGGDPLKFCKGVCAENWVPLVAPADAKPTGYWKVVEGAQGPQWAYKNSPVFTYKADKGPGALDGDGADEMWNALAYIPPVPTIAAPGNVTPTFAKGEYVLTDKQGHALYTGGKSVADQKPFSAGMASQSVGDWSVVRDGDRPQWAYRGKPVYVSEADQAEQVPDDSATILKP
jgi:predicted lipoprotein with Yx(FWY)xxD motif